MLQKFTKKKNKSQNTVFVVFWGGEDNNVSHNRDKLIVNA